MKYIDEFRDKAAIRKLADAIQAAATPPINLMEVCGTHTMAIFRAGIRQLLPASIRLISGPGCPVCVSSQSDIDAMLALARIKNVCITSFGDMLKVPGSASSLEKERAAGCDIRAVYSPLDALEIARKNKNKEVVFLAVGFETTSPAIASVVSDAAKERILNFSVYACHKLIAPAMEALLDAAELKIDGFICPGHVTTIIGPAAYDRVVSEFRIPCVVSGFEPVDILETIQLLLQQIKQKNPRVQIQYRRAVSPGGNLRAQELLRAVFEPCDADWRGLGIIPRSGLRLRKEFALFDAARKFAIKTPPAVEPKNCLCGQVLRGVKTPDACKLFAKACTPENPYGPCMVSSEGTCAAWYRYNR